MYNTAGTVFNIQRFSTYDGPGIRTCVFLKGCPLHCLWCHNPESHSTGVQMFYRADLCAGCGACAAACPAGCHRMDMGKHVFDRSLCQSCGRCADVCPANAMEMCGGTMSAEEVMQEVLHDRLFYGTSGGGMTLSGGEPLMQFDFVLALLQLAKENGIHTAVETSGYTHRDIIELAPYTDLWLYDVKLTDEAKHIAYTGVSKQLILENLRRLDAAGAKIVMRCPIIPDVNLDPDHFDGLANLARSLKNISAIHLEPYHPLGVSKARQLGMTPGYAGEHSLDRSLLVPYAGELQAKTGIEVIIS
ncbi:MAG: glycyl-radical enzyme activating protein [Clostridiales bacterium]|nr:glycyl-radical enzyme activating protein [Clostridiales bacterium]